MYLFIEKGINPNTTKLKRKHFREGKNSNKPIKQTCQTDTFNLFEKHESSVMHDKFVNMVGHPE